MRLGLVVEHLDRGRGGAETHLAALVARALETGEEVVVASFDGRVPEGATGLAIAAPRRRPAREQALAARGVAALDAAGCDVVLAARHVADCDVYLPHGGLVGDARAARAAARGRSPARVGAGARRFRHFLAVERQLLGSVEGPLVVAVSQGLAARIAAVYPAAARRVVVVPNGVDVARFDPDAWQAERERLRAAHGWTKAYVGLLLAHDPWLKGLATAIDALAHERVVALDPPFHLAVAGRRLPRALARRARRLGVADRLHALGAQDDPRPLLAACDVLVHPTWHDPMSLVCLEAMAMARPVVTTPANGVRELMGRRGGIVVEAPGEPEAIATALAVLADPALRAETGDDARYLASTRRLATSLDRLLDHVRRMAAQRPRSARRRPA